MQEIIRCTEKKVDKAVVILTISWQQLYAKKDFGHHQYYAVSFEYLCVHIKTYLNTPIQKLSIDHNYCIWQKGHTLYSEHF